MKRAILVVAFGVSILGGVAIVMSMAAPKILICHHPSEDPTKAHTIQVSDKELSNHLKHGDTLGPCPGSPKK